MITLEVADLVIIASRTLELDTDRVLDLLDPTAAEHALAQTRSAGDADDPASRAAALLHALVYHSPLRRGNQPVALVAMLQFLALNGWEVDPDPPEATRTVVAELAAGTLGTKDIAAWLVPRLRPSDRAATCAKEAPMRGWLPLAEKIRMATMRTQPKGMFQRFTDRARRAVHLAQEEARLLRHNYVGTEHLLLGLLHEGEGVAATALDSLGISLEAVRAQVEEIIGRGPTTPTGHIPFTPRAKKVLELSLRQALQLGHNYIGTEHLLLGLLREGEGVAAQALARLGADHARVREGVLELLTGKGEEPGAETRLVRLTPPVDLVDAAEQLAQVRRQKEAAIDAGDLDSATALRDREKQLLADKLRREREWTAGVDVQTVIAENQRLHRELERLRGLLRQHGIEPNGGTARTA
jgi:ATP-dependent Clp protease ATP-binding subunit ClpA/prophage maintenance system killer protein